ncbi:hypothetical protein PTSG_11308 [Salpingoeca rosetta]|uniref:inorganic diphosphatase n=1 Tax=Salpingoeca rosetta (strain ATCC 50818 / BSB-021) TaxID=946362 RepID=F2UT12_SALR5|nr:uncharacterized protein PTSG_11308 [Salpingoeca rosetta]EGD81271.1 hypothetical protein PTSG_11308 [Salpingoeca rosetta]|eukprot:XP_004987667.1 hypothetical protein PTSG_11308 [Salpingoeca rosetta]
MVMMMMMRFVRLGLPVVAITSALARAGTSTSCPAAAAAAAATMMGGGMRFNSSQAATVCVFGHKIPDTDAVCAAIVRAIELEHDGSKATAYRLGDLNPETEYVLQRFKVDVPPLLPDLRARPCDSVAIVDTNNPAELPSDIAKANVTSIIDHHKLAGLTTMAPLEMDVRPLCSTGSVLFHRFKAKGYTITPEVAQLMLACILSDSLHFRSVTTTDADEQAAKELEAIAGVSAAELGPAMLEAKSRVSHLSGEQLVLLDSKTYTLHGERTRVSVVETTHGPSVLARSKDILEAAHTVKARESLDRVLFFVVDITAGRAVLVTDDQVEAARVSDAFSKAGIKASVSETEDGELHVVLHGVLSRKKQMIPALEA